MLFNNRDEVSVRVGAEGRCREENIYYTFRIYIFLKDCLQGGFLKHDTQGIFPGILIFGEAYAVTLHSGPAVTVASCILKRATLHKCPLLVNCLLLFSFSAKTKFSL